MPSPHGWLTNLMKLVPTILCGGAGSRLWPVSRELHPKPFIQLADGQSLLQKAFFRGAALPDVCEIVTVTNRDLVFKVQDEYSEINERTIPTSFILEPFGRNTAPAIAAATLHVKQEHGEDAIMLVLAADHLIADQTAFAAAVQRAMTLAATGRIVTFGIRPDAPETGYGYIETKGEQVIQFVEKPSLERARSYLAAGNYLWNSGMFCFSVSAILRDFRRFSPEALDTVETCLAKSARMEGNGTIQIQLDPDSFSAVPDISVDYAVMERTERMGVVPCDIGWSDIGSWTALSELSEADSSGNRIAGSAMLHDSFNCYVRSADRLIGTVGIEDLLIIDTSDALLVAHRDRAQDVKAIYARLKAQGHQSYRLHQTVHRPWGTYTILEEGEGFKIKRIEVKPQASLSLQMHHHRSEHWVVVNGEAKVVNGERVFLLATNESTFIPAGHKHRLENPGLTQLVMIEVQSGDYLGEDDIVRFQDDYGRA
jgi:mannose-1-phosphate guanylyltransferase / mannose-6-phosphate isomerase